MAYRANNGRKFFNPDSVVDGVWRSKTSWQPFHSIRGRDGRGSWGIDRRVAERELPRYGCRTIEKFDKRTGILYTVSYDYFAENCTLHDAGHGMQGFLPLEEWDAKQIAEPQPVEELKIEPVKPRGHFRPSKAHREEVRRQALERVQQ